MKIENGSLIIGHWKGAQIKLNWTIPLTAVFFGRFEFVPMFWIAFFVLVFIHEAGHAFVIRSYQLWIKEIVIHGFGGYVRWFGEVDEMKRALIAWGGIFAQLIVLILALIATFVFGPVKSSFQAQIYRVFIHTNIIMIVFNLLPMKPLDGVKAWKIITPFCDFISSKSADLKRQRQDRIVQKQLEEMMKI